MVGGTDGQLQYELGSKVAPTTHHLTLSTAAPAGPKYVTLRAFRPTQHSKAQHGMAHNRFSAGHTLII
jgi:hypothetical protein